MPIADGIIERLIVATRFPRNRQPGQAAQLGPGAWCGPAQINCWLPAQSLSVGKPGAATRVWEVVRDRARAGGQEDTARWTVGSMCVFEAVMDRAGGRDTVAADRPHAGRCPEPISRGGGPGATTSIV